MSAPSCAQCIDQVADRPLVHARHAGQPVVPAGQRQRRGQRTKRRAGVAEEQFRLLDRKRPPHPSHLQHAARRIRSSCTPSVRARPACVRYRRNRADRGSRVAPSASAASSKMRLEMLFEPGSRTLPLAPAQRRQIEMVRIALGHSALRLASGATSALRASAGVGEHALQCRTRRCAAIMRTRFDGRAVAIQLRQERLAVRDRRCRATSRESCRRCA